MKGSAALLVVLALLTTLSPIVTTLIPRALASSPPVAGFNWTPCTACAVLGDLFFFNGNSSFSTSSSVVLYSWNFGDGTMVSATGPLTFHDYPLGVPSSGVNVTLTVQDSTGQMGSLRQLIMFETIPSFTFNPVSPAVGQKVTFDASSSKSFNNPILGYQWDFGDGVTGSGVVATHSYSAAGPYRVGLTLLTQFGQPATSTKIVVGDLVLKATFDHVNVTVTGSFSLNQTSRTIKASLSVTVVNATSGALIVSKSFSVTITLGPNGLAVFVLALPANSFILGIGCSADIVGARGCVLSKSPDLNNDGKVDILDLSTMALAFNSTPGTSTWNPAADLNNNGIVDIIDMSIAAFDFDAPVFS